MVMMTVGGASAERAVVFDGGALSWDEQCAAEALQGIVNRRGARLFLGEAGDPWLRIYGERNGMEYETLEGFRNLLARYRDHVKGFVVYDAAVDGARYVAITQAGLEDLVPISGEMLEGLSELGMPIVSDLRGKFADSLEAYEWALEVLMPRCNRRYAHAAGGPCEGIRALCGPMPGMDWMTMNQGFVFNLVPSPTEMASYGGATVGGSPEQAAMYERIVAALEPPCMITGYGEPEDFWCKLISEHGHYSFHFGRNWSFHKGIPHRGELRQKRQVTPETVEVEADKYYVCFMTSEGDTMKGPLPFFMESWFDPDRGTIPMNWGINPLMGELFPAMLEYYYDEATDNDYFFTGCSGAGYVYPDFMPNLKQFARHTARACKLADAPCVDLWHAGSPEVRREYAVHSKAMALTANGGAARMTMAAPGKLLVDHGLMYWQHEATGGTAYYRDFRDEAKRAKAVDWLVGRIEDIAARHTPPFVILVYADLHSYDRHVMVHREAAEKLDPERFKPARLDEALAAVTAWTRGRVLVGHGSINERLSAAYLEGVPTKYALSLTNGTEKRRRVSVALEGEEAETVEVGPGKEATAELLLTGEAGAKVLVDGDEYPLDLTAVPYEGEAKSAEFAGVWDAVDLRHSGGSIEPREDAMWGRAWSSPEAGGEQGHIVFGPYAHLPTGRYVVAFRMMLADEVEDGTEVVTLDVNAGGYEGTGEQFGVREVTAGELGEPGEWAWVSSEIDWPGPPSRLETRVWWHGRARVVVDRVAAARTDG